MDAHPHTPAPLPTLDDLAVIEVARDIATGVLAAVRADLLAGWGTARGTDKADGSPVTELDLATDRAFVSAVNEHLPAHGVVSEEGRTAWDGSEWTWVIDPIDGTTNFAAGLPYWATSIALAHRGAVVWGMVDVPCIGRRYEATRGAGATCNDTPLQVRPQFDLDDRASRHIPMSVSAGAVRRVVPGTSFKTRITGSVALDLALVAAGALGASFHRTPAVWDVAAGTLLVTEAGGSIVEYDDPGCLPLRAAHDCTDQRVRTVAGPNREWVMDATPRLWPPAEDGSF